MVQRGAFLHNCGGKRTAKSCAATGEGTGVLRGAEIWGSSKAYLSGLLDTKNISVFSHVGLLSSLAPVAFSVDKIFITIHFTSNPLFPSSKLWRLCP